MSSQTEGRALFVYGSLLIEEVFQIVVGHPVVMHRATLQDHARRALHDAVYPGLVPRQGECTEGRVAVGLDKEDLARLDHFEGDLYQRSPCVVETEDGSPQAFVYVVRPAHRGLLAPEDWDLERFVQDELPRYLKGCRRFAEELDETLR